MQDLSVLVNNQSETLGEVVKHTEKTKERTKKALDELRYAEKMQKTSECIIA